MSGFRPLGTGEVVRFSWDLYKRRFGSLIGVSLTLLALPSLLQWLPGVGLMMSILLLFAELLAIGAFIRIVASHCVGLHFSAAEAIRMAWRQYGNMLLMVVVFALAVAAVAAVMTMIGSAILAVVAPGFAAEVSSYGDDPFSMPAETLLPFLLWTFVMVLPAICLAMTWWVAPMGLTVEGTAAIPSLVRSWKLVLPNLWRTIKVLLLALLVVALPFLVIYRILPYHWAVLLLNVFGLPFSWVVATVLYLDLRVRSEGLGPETLVHELT
ncbi:MAG: hypothetical protein F4Y40_06230 [Acidimicrobiia bacterium]|nr:hypothetical protein [Acidimicrobiia bacterium]